MRWVNEEALLMKQSGGFMGDKPLTHERRRDPIAEAQQRSRRFWWIVLGAAILGGVAIVAAMRFF